MRMCIPYGPLVRTPHAYGEHPGKGIAHMPWPPAAIPNSKPRGRHWHNSGSGWYKPARCRPRNCNCYNECICGCAGSRRLLPSSKSSDCAAAEHIRRPQHARRRRRIPRPAAAAHHSLALGGGSSQVLRIPRSIIHRLALAVHASAGATKSMPLVLNCGVGQAPTCTPAPMARPLVALASRSIPGRQHFPRGRGGYK